MSKQQPSKSDRMFASKLTRWKLFLRENKGRSGGGNGRRKTGRVREMWGKWGSYGRQSSRGCQGDSLINWSSASDTNQRFAGSNKFAEDMPGYTHAHIYPRRRRRPRLEILIKSDDTASNSISKCRLLILRTFPLLIHCQYYIEAIIYT